MDDHECCKCVPAYQRSWLSDYYRFIFCRDELKKAKKKIRQLERVISEMQA